MRHRRLALVLLVLVGIVGAGAWLGWTALQARASLERARSALPEVQEALAAGDAAGATARLAQVRTDADAAYDHTHDPVWAVASRVPVLGQPLQTVRGITSAVRELGSTGLPALASVASDLRPAALRPEPDRLDLTLLARSSGPLQVAAESLSAQRQAVAELPASWLPQVADARTQLLEQLEPLDTASRKASLASQLLPPMLGADGPRRYFVGFQNPAEARGTGGLLGAFAIVSADQGRLRVERLGPNYELPDLPADVPDLDPEFVARYGSQGAAALWVNANVSPDFPEVARTWLAMWRAGTGEQLDGALAMDPQVLAAVLRATGPLDVPGLGRVDGDRVVPLVLREQYELVDAAGARKDVMVGVGSQAVAALLDGRTDAQRLIDELSAPAVAGHVLVASSRPDEQAALRRAGIAGAVPDTALPFAQAVVVNAAGGKLDTYLGTELSYEVTRCTSDERTSVITVELTNDAPAQGLPAYVVTRADQPPYATVPGQNRTDLRVLLTRGAQLGSARLDGKPLLAPEVGELPDTIPAGTALAFLSRTTQAGRPSYGLTLELPPGTGHTLELTVDEPASTLAPELPLQRTALEGRATADVSACL